jgi:hypothetical protein
MQAEAGAAGPVEPEAPGQGFPEAEPEKPVVSEGQPLDEASLEGLSLDNVSLDDLSIDTPLAAQRPEPDSSLINLPPEAEPETTHYRQAPSGETRAASEAPEAPREALPPDTGEDEPLELHTRVEDEAIKGSGNGDPLGAASSPERTDYLEADTSYSGVEQGADPGEDVPQEEEKAPFEKLAGNAEIQSPYTMAKAGGKAQAESSTAVIVNYLEDKEESLASGQGEFGALDADDDLDLDLLEMGSPSSFKAKPMVHVPRQPR